MCSRMRLERQIEATGDFMKGNEPESLRMPIWAVQCQCGAWHARAYGGSVWVDAVPVPA